MIHADYLEAVLLIATEGYADWRNIGQVLKSYENSQKHYQCQIILFQRTNLISRIDSDLQNQIQAEINYWHNVFLPELKTM